VGGKTTPLNLTGFYGIACAPPGDGSSGDCQRDFLTGTVTGSTSLGSVTGKLKIEQTYYEVDPSRPQQGVMTLVFNGTDSLNVLANWGNSSTFPIVGGTGTYAGVTGSLSVSNVHSGSTGYEFKGTGTVTTAAAGAPIITQVKMAFGSSTLIAKNGWLQINGSNLVPADTPPSGVDWSNAPEFASGMMPTGLGAIDSVMIDGLPAYIYFYCSGDESELRGSRPDQRPVTLLPSRKRHSNRGHAQWCRERAVCDRRAGYFPGAPVLRCTRARGRQASGWQPCGSDDVVSRSINASDGGETVILVAFGLQLPKNNAVEGSGVQTGPGRVGVECWISGPVYQNVPAAFISPGLTQLNVTIPPGTPSGDNPIMCAAGDIPFPPGAMITGAEKKPDQSADTPDQQSGQWSSDRYYLRTSTGNRSRLSRIRFALRSL
jgi:hypothetical protein